MDPISKAALQDLLGIRALSDIRPQQVQAWQQAARVVLGAADDKGRSESAATVRPFAKKHEPIANVASAEEGAL